MKLEEKIYIKEENKVQINENESYEKLIRKRYWRQKNKLWMNEDGRKELHIKLNNFYIIFEKIKLYSVTSDVY